MTGSTKVLPVRVFSELIKISIADQYKVKISHAVIKAVSAGPPNSSPCKASVKVKRHVGRMTRNVLFVHSKGQLMVFFFLISGTQNRTISHRHIKIH